jgi:predicted N-acetyltransferase YhbS
MNLTVRPADIPRERASVIDLMQRYLSPEADAARFAWLYERGPYKPPKVWVACDERLGAVVGMAGAFHRLFFVGGRELEGYVLGDFCFHSSYRSLGPALQLQRACLEGVRNFQLGLGYDFPSTSMAAVYSRLGVTPMHSFVRVARPLRADRKLAGMIKPQWAAKCLAGAANLGLKVRDLRIRQRSSLRIGIHEQDCGSEFTDLARKTACEERICVARTAEYLNWRYRAHPTRKHRLVTARLGEELMGYAVYVEDRADATIVDLVAKREAGVEGELVLHLVRELRKKGTNTLSARMLCGDPQGEVFRQMGFRARESTPVALFGSETNVGRSASGAKPSWHLMDGDRES